MKVEIKTERIEDLFFCGTKPALELKLMYPQIAGYIQEITERRFNRYYALQARRINEYVRTVMYREALKDCKEREKSGFPFNFWTYDRRFDVSFVSEKLVSLFFDTYIYKGGAHGMTERTSDTWSLSYAQIIPLQRFFVKGFDYASFITLIISAEIKRDLGSPDSVYYKNAPEKSIKLFNEKRYYISDTGFVFYYPSYTLAPYYAGIRVFEIPYEAFGNKLRQDLFA